MIKLLGGAAFAALLAVSASFAGTATVPMLMTPVSGGGGGSPTVTPQVTAATPVNGTSITAATSGATHVGDIIEAFTGFYGTGGQTVTVTDAESDTCTQKSAKVSGSNTVFLVRCPVTTADASAVNVTATFSGSVSDAFMHVIYLPAPSGYQFGSSPDFVATAQSGSSGTMTLSGSASQANDVLISGTADGATAIGSGQTTLDDETSIDVWSSYSQPSASGSVSHTYTLGSDTAGVMLAETVSTSGGGGSQSISSVSPSSCTFTHGTSSNCSVTVTMSPTTPSFDTDGGTLSLVSSGGSCSGTEDTTDFGTGTAPDQITYNGSAAAGSYNVCLKASVSGMSSVYEQVAVTVNTSGVACDFGPNAPSIPAAANAAGFTHCVANYDFTSASNFTSNGHTYNFSDMTTWLDCKGASYPLFTIAYGNCAHMTMITDGGVQTFDLQLTTGDFSSADNAVIQTSGASNDSNLADAIMTTPTGKYVEFVTRATSQDESDYDSGINDVMTAFWWWGGNGNSNFVEWDDLETYANGAGGFQPHAQDGATGGFSSIGEDNSVSGYDPTVYNTYGIRTATDTSGNVAECTYLNGSIIPSGMSTNCSTGQFTPYPLGHDFFVLTAGPEDTNTSLHGNVDNLVQRVTIWSCSGYAAGECTNSTTAVTTGALTDAP